jgi:ABC-type polysaccharide/polyol phosphate export permease
MQLAFFDPDPLDAQTIHGRVPQAFSELNPFFHLVALVRDPLLGHYPSDTG